jgi:hypothetical protein
MVPRMKLDSREPGIQVCRSHECVGGFADTSVLYGNDGVLFFFSAFKCALEVQPTLHSESELKRAEDVVPYTRCC